MLTRFFVLLALISFARLLVYSEDQMLAFVFFVILGTSALVSHELDLHRAWRSRDEHLKNMMAMHASTVAALEAIPGAEKELAAARAARPTQS